MATAAEIPIDHVWGGQFTNEAFKDKFTAEELKILNKPCAMAVAEMGCKRPDLVVYAAKLIELHNRPLQGTTLLVEVDRLEDLEKRGRDLPPLEPPPPIDSDPDIWSDSDSDSDCDSMEYFSSNEPHEPEKSIANIVNDDDCQTDCPPPKLSEKDTELDMPKAVVKGANFHPELLCKKTKKADDILDQKQRLWVLRLENKKLKERQLCQKCHSQTVSITFLPCGHYAYCYECGQSFTSCPICCKTILADVKTFLA